MTDTIIKLSQDDVWQAVGAIDPVAAVAEDLIGRTLDRSEHEPRVPGRLTPWHGRSGHVVIEPTTGGVGYVAPVTSLRLARAAALVALAARELLVPGGLTVAVIGATGPIHRQLAVMTRHLPDISHVALWPADPVDQDLLDQLASGGIRVLVATSLDGALFGANLVIVIGANTRPGGGDCPRPGQFARGAVLVNAAGHDLPEELVGRMDDIYVDDLGLLTANEHRHVVGSHLTATSSGDRVPRIVDDLGHLLIGRAGHGKRVGANVLVELLGVAELSVDFACRVCRAAGQAGLGTRISGSPA